jgi:hypothetical protein
MNRLATAILVAMAVSASAADRIINQTVDTSTARVQPQAIGFFRGESVTYTVTPLLGTNAISVSTNAASYWTVCYASNINVGVLSLTGTVTTAGVSVFSAAITNTLMSAGKYDSFVNIMDTGALVTSSRSTLEVYKSPYAGTTAFPAISFSEPLWVAASNSIVYSNQMGGGATWSGSNWTFAAASESVTNVTGGLLTLTAKQIGLTSGAVSGAVAGVYQPAGNYLTAEADTNALTRLAAHSNLTAYAGHPGTGSASTNETADFATAAQGALADSALQRYDTGMVRIAQSPGTNYFGVHWIGGTETNDDLGIRLYGAGVDENEGDPAVRFHNITSTGKLAYTVGDYTGFDFDKPVRATSFSGDGSALTGLTSTQIAAAGGLTNGQVSLAAGTGITLNGGTNAVSLSTGTVTIASTATGGGSSVTTNWIDAMAIGVGLETAFPTYQIRTNANGSMPVLAWDKTVAGAWAGPIIITPWSSNITTYSVGYHSTTGTTSVAFRWRNGLNAWSAVTTSALQNAVGTLTNFDTITNTISGLTPGVPIEAEITTISTNSGTSGGYHYMRAWGWTP